MNVTRVDKRMESIRSLPQGQFDKYRQMFDLKKSKNKKHKTLYPDSDIIDEADEYTHDELASSSLNSVESPERLQLEMNKIFDGVSNDTNSLITSLCSTNLNINEFMSSSNTTTNSNKSSISSNGQEWFQAIPVYNDVDILEAIPVYNDADVLEVSRPVSDMSSLEKEDDVDFSDDSYDEMDPQDTESSYEVSIIDERASNSVIHLGAPPKPVRTFEHDVYVEAKLRNNLDGIKELDGSHFYESVERFNCEDVDVNSRSLVRKSELNSFIQEPINLTSSAKIAISMPNLTQIEKSNKKSTFKPFGRLFSQLKKSLSRKSLNQTDLIEEDVLPDPLANVPDYDPPINTVILRRMHSNKRIYEKLRTKSHIYSERTELNQNLNSLFDYCLIVSLRESSKSISTGQLNNERFLNKLNPNICWKFPDRLGNLLNESIAEFCFPDPACQYDLTKKNGFETWQFTLTNLDGNRTYGNCIKIFNKKKHPLVFCIVSRVDAHEMYHTLLLEAVNIYNQSNLESVKTFLTSIYSNPLPNRGHQLTLKFNQKEIVLDRNYDRRLQHINLGIILSLPYDLVIKIFGSMLAEKKVIFLSNKLGVMTNVIQAFETLLYPFTWPHTFIPVLPSYLIDICDAPTPYIVGVMKTNKNELMAKYKGVNDILIVDLDKSRCIQEEGNELSVIPAKLLRTFRAELAILKSRKEDRDTTQSQRNLNICMTFLKFFVKTVGNYRQFLQPSDDCIHAGDKFKFNSVEFVENAESEDLRDFLEWFVHTQLFDVFITRKLNPDLKFGLMFDSEIQNYESNKSMKPIATSNVKKSDEKIVIYKF